MCGVYFIVARFEPSVAAAAAAASAGAGESRAV